MNRLSNIRTLMAGTALTAVLALPASARDIQFAGFTSLGANKDVATNYRWSAELMAEKDANGVFVLDKAVRDRLSSIRNPTFTLLMDERLGDIRPGSTSTIASAFALDRETVSIEKIGDRWKLMVTLSAQALFFDFKEKALIASWPSVVRYTDATTHEPTDDDIRAIVRGLYLGHLGVNLLDDVARSFATLELDPEVGNRVQIKSVTIGDEAKANLPAQFAANEENLKSLVAQEFNKSLSVNQHIPVLPYMAGYAAAVQGSMALRFGDSSVFDLKIPEADYEINLSLNNLKKIEYASTAVGTSYIYGAYLGVKALEPLSNKVYFDETIKNGATKLVPASQTNVEDWPAFHESLLILMDKFTQALDAPTGEWAEKHTGNKSAVAELKNLQRVLQSCR